MGPKSIGVDTRHWSVTSAEVNSGFTVQELHSNFCPAPHWSSWGSSLCEMLSFPCSVAPSFLLAIISSSGISKQRKTWEQVCDVRHTYSHYLWLLFLLLLLLCRNAKMSQLVFESECPERAQCQLTAWGKLCPRLPVRFPVPSFFLFQCMSAYVRELPQQGEANSFSAVCREAVW